MKYNYLNPKIKESIKNSVEKIIDYIEVLTEPFEEVYEKYLIKESVVYKFYFVVEKTKNKDTTLYFRYVFDKQVTATIPIAKLNYEDITDEKGLYELKIPHNNGLYVKSQVIKVDIYRLFYEYLILMWKEPKENFPFGLKGTLNYSLDTNHIRNFQI